MEQTKNKQTSNVS